ncbi:Uu.00g011970.m01.CDS01 [Anthostomella pinea]|uniref:Uu.00g011970.m01.CDS01 n=1 Tax=Anthostomella pinea TaxID=933095 RepID=A0AAI8VZ37_9PEZI|nr:Uu.00g011970.m01.CDS01 [Anthostomella pinea]
MSQESTVRSVDAAERASGSSAVKPEALLEPIEWSWADDECNPYNWPKWKKNVQLASIAFVAFTGSLGTSIISPAHQELIDEFGVSSTVAFLPLTFYVLALGLGPVCGGPLSETAGRQAVWLMAVFLGGLFALGSGLSPTFAGLCIMRFLAGFFYGPGLAIGTGVLAETYTPAERGPPSSLYILSPFLGPGFGPVLGVFLVDRMGWRWTQYTLVFFSVFSLIWVLAASETYHPVIQRRRMKQLGLDPPKKIPLSTTLRTFATTGVIRPLHMMFTEPIVGFLCLYVACMFGILFSFFGVFFWIFKTVYDFTLVQSGLVFLAIAFGCIVGAGIINLCNKLLYRPQVRRFPPHQVPPEYRLGPAMIGSVLLPISLFWFAWTTRADVNPAVPIVAIAIFGMGNINLFISSLQYIGDVYHRTNVASAASANSFARYVLAAVFPLFSLQMYQGLGIAWASTLLGFVSLALLPLPWLLFKFGNNVRRKSRYETASY